MRVLIVGDDFIKSDMVERELEKTLGSTTQLEYVHHWTNWPTAPFEFDDEIGEYVGNCGEIAELARDADIIFAHMAPLNARVMQSAQRLKAIAVTRGGPINVNIAEATKRGIPVFNMPGRNARTVAEFTVAFILDLAKRITEAHQDLRNGIWRTELYCYDEAAYELPGRRVGLIGYGNIGRLVTQMLAPFGVDIVVYDPYVNLEQENVTQVDLDELLKTSDFVSLHARVTPETEKLMNADRLAMMKPSAYLINTARGPLIDYAALVKALENNVIRGAALDTFDVEPIAADHPLTKMSNVILTPHVAGSSKQVAERAIASLARDLQSYFAGGKPENCMNPETLT